MLLFITTDNITCLISTHISSIELLWFMEIHDGSYDGSIIIFSFLDESQDIGILTEPSARLWQHTHPVLSCGSKSVCFFL